MISVNAAGLFADGQAVLIRECEFTAAQFNDIINHAGIETKFKDDNAAEIPHQKITHMGDENSHEICNEVAERNEDLITHLKNKTNISSGHVKPNGKACAEGSENKYINLVVLRKKKKKTEKSCPILSPIKKEGKSFSGNPVALCSMCGKNFSSNFNLKRHMASCKLCPEEERGPRFQCQCGRTYSQEWDMKKHRLSCQDSGKKCKSCLFPFCNLLFYHRSQLLAHMKSVHNVSIRDPEVLDFESIEDFKFWKERVEEDTYTYYSKQTGSNVTGVSVNTYYVCQHDGSDRTHSTTPRKTERRNKKGRVKTGRFCWSQMNVKEFRDGSVRVTFYPSHTHPVSAADTEHHPLPSSITTEIQRRLTEIKSEEHLPAAPDYPEFKKTRKKSYAMNVRTLRALARKNRKLFRITAEAIDGVEDVKGVEEAEEQEMQQQQPAMETENSLITVPTEEVQVIEEPAREPSRDQVIGACSTHWDELQELMASGNLNHATLTRVQNTLAGLVESCRDEMHQIKEECGPAPSLTELTEAIYQAGPSSPSGFLLTEDPQSTVQLQQNEKTVYQVVTLGTKQEPLSPQPEELLFHNAVEFLGPREFIIIANDHAQIFQSVNSNQLSLS